MCVNVIESSYIESEMDKYRVPGMGIGVIKNGKILLSCGYGFADIEKQTLFNDKTQFGIASCSKAFTSTLIGMLVDEDYFRFDQPVSEYCQDFRMFDHVATMQCTIRDILCHRTGLGGHDALWVDSISREELWKRLKYLEPNKPFRSTVQYSNLMYTIAGHIAEKVTGASWDELITEKILKPLKMNNSNTSITDMLKTENYATPYWQSDDGPLEIEPWNVDLGGPAASINSCVFDMLKWLKFQLNPEIAEGKRYIIKSSTLKEIHTAQVPYKLWAWDFIELTPMGHYGLGWMMDTYRGRHMIFHYGEIEGYCSLQVFLPYENLGIICAVNLHKPCVLILNSVIYTIIDNILGLPKVDWPGKFYNERNNYGGMLEDWNMNLFNGKQVTHTQLSHKNEEYVGTYRNPGYGDITIRCKNGKFTCLYRNVVQEMYYYHYDTFRVPHIKMDTLLWTVPLSFITDPLTGEINKVEFMLEYRVNPIVFTRV